MALCADVPRAHLRLRSTFIDVSDDEGDAEEHRSARRQSRAKTLPAPPVEPDASSIFDGERAYVSDLSAKLGPLWDEASAPEEDLHGATAMKSFFARSRIAPSRTRRLGPSLAHAEKSGQVASHSAPAVMAVAGSEPSSLSACAASDASSPAPSARLVEDEAADNVGSVGHPFLCSRPCLYYASGQCANGVACNFCHVAHAKRFTHLDKKHREALRELPSAKAKVLMLPVLREKVLAFDSSPATLVALDRLAAACNVGGAPHGERRSRSDKSLVVALTAVSLRVVVAALQRAAPDADHVLHGAAEALMQQLRRVAAGTGAA